MTNWHVAFFIINIFVWSSLIGSIHLWDSEYFFVSLINFPYQDSFSFSNISMYYSLFHWITCDNRGFKYFKFAMIFPICWNNWCLFLDGYYIYYICIICKQLFLLYFIIFILFFWNLFLHFYPFFFFACIYHELNKNINYVFRTL